MNNNDSQNIDLDKLKELFIQEANELINTLEEATLAMENQPGDIGQVESIFRVMHTLKGSGGMFGFDKISEFTHDLETIYDYVRKSELKVDKNLLDITLQSVDHLKELISQGDDLDAKQLKNHRHYTAMIKDFAEQNIKKKSASQQNQEIAVAPASTPADAGINTYYISFKPNEYAFNNGTNPLYLLDEFHTRGAAYAIPHCDTIDELEKYDPEKCYVWWEIFVATTENEGALADVFIFVEDDSSIIIRKIADDNLFLITAFKTYCSEIKNNKTKIDLKQVKKIYDEAPPASETIQPLAEPANNHQTIIFDNESQNSTDDEIIHNEFSALKKEEQTPTANIKPDKSQPSSANEAISSIRVSSEKIDTLMNLVSELVTIQARLTMHAEADKNPDLVSIAEQVQKLSMQLRDNAFSISLIPLGSVVTRFQRLVRDLSASLNKEVDFIIEGQGTELDKTIIERVTDPLMHILRNSLDHGIESAEIRKKKGKPAKGVIKLKAYHSGSNVHIEISDDGAGIDPARIFRKAVQSKLVSENDNLSKKQILNLVFTPGFSTATQVSNVSGRGVGMDVVSRKVSEIRGQVLIESEINIGTTITIVLPLTLSIIDGMQTRIDNTCFIVPTSSVHKIYSVSHQIIEQAFDSIIVLENQQIPCFYLRRQFGIQSKPPGKEEVLVVKYENRQVGLIIDKVIGEYQTVLKPLGKHYKEQEFVSGGTILGDGTVALVLDTNKIISKFSNEPLAMEEKYDQRN
jgi:two-component system, chemotaxis family, sensor kinase CheA